MKFNNRKFDFKKREEFEEQIDHETRKRKKDRRDKYKPKNQKAHQYGMFEPDGDEYGGMF